MKLRVFFPKNLQFDPPPLQLGTKEYVVHLCRSFEYGTLIFKNCAANDVASEKYVGSL